MHQAGPLLAGDELRRGDDFVVLPQLLLLRDLLLQRIDVAHPLQFAAVELLQHDRALLQQGGDVVKPAPLRVSSFLPPISRQHVQRPRGHRDRDVRRQGPRRGGPDQQVMRLPPAAASRSL